MIRAHSLFPSVLKAQAEAIGLPLFTYQKLGGGCTKKFLLRN